MKATDQSFRTRIETIVEQLLATSHAAAIAAIDQAFDRGKIPSKSKSVPSPKKNKTRTTVAYRTPKEMAEICERLLEMIRDQPGQGVAVLAPQLGMQTADLKTPLARLRQAGKIRSVGQRQFTRYFPVDDVQEDE